MPPEGSDAALAPITALIGVYDADGTVRGELSYWIGARLGTRHCALCEVTHGTFRRKPEWQAVCDRLDTPFRAVHLDERDALTAETSRGLEPCVVAVRADGSAEVVVTREELERCEGDPERLGRLLEALS